MTKSDRAALRALLERATPGPWEAWEGCRAGMPERERALMQHVDHDSIVIAMQRDTLRSWAFEDAALIVAARNSLAGLLTYVDALEAIAGAIDDTEMGEWCSDTALAEAIAVYRKVRP